MYATTLGNKDSDDPTTTCDISDSSWRQPCSDSLKIQPPHTPAHTVLNQNLILSTNDKILLLIMYHFANDSSSHEGVEL